MNDKASVKNPDDAITNCLSNLLCWSGFLKHDTPWIRKSELNEISSVRHAPHLPITKSQMQRLEAGYPNSWMDHTAMSDEHLIRTCANTFSSPKIHCSSEGPASSHPMPSTYVTDS